jgi:hypothetical protein
VQQRTSILTLLFKKGDHLNLDNYRPISLLNVDLKILSYVLAQRLKKLLPKIINEDQTSYVKIRFIGCIPQEFLKFSDTQPLFITHVCISLYSVLTQLIKDSLNLKCFKVPNIKSHSKESKAFEKS